MGGRGVRKGAEKNNTKKVAEAIEANRNVKCELGDNSTVAPKREAYYKATDIHTYIMLDRAMFEVIYSARPSVKCVPLCWTK